MQKQINSCGWIRVKPHEDTGHGKQISFFHRHEFIEMNYILCGSCCQNVAGRQYTMRVGDLLILDMQTRHSVDWLDQNTLLINILLLPQQAERFLQSLLPDHAPLSAFVFQAAYQLSTQPNYLLFHMGKNQPFQDTMFHFLCECYFPRDRNDTTLMVSYLRTIFALLSQELSLSPQMVECVYPPESRIGPIVHYIQEHCKDCTREDVAKTFGYTKNYVSMLLKKHTGLTFLDLRNDFRLTEIHNILQAKPDISVHSLIEEYGFTNSSYFFRLYKTKFGTTPRQTAANVSFSPNN